MWIKPVVNRISRATFVLFSLSQLGCVDRGQPEWVQQVEQLQSHLDTVVARQNQLIEASERLLPDHLDSVTLTITELGVTHRVKALAEYYEVNAQIMPQVPDYLNTNTLEVHLNYTLAVKEKGWQREGVWTRTIRTDAPSPIALEVRLPETGFEQASVSVTFEGLGAVPMVPLSVYRE